MPPKSNSSTVSVDTGPAKRLTLLDTKSLSREDILSLFKHADELNGFGARFGNFFDPASQSSRAQKVVCCLFFEPSTRTRMSFQTAAYRLGHQVLTMELFSGSSLTKGESYADTILNIAAMKPDAMVVRYGKSTELDEILPTLTMPVLNAGSGTLAHPTQALLDSYTIYRERGSLEGQKVLIVGDIKHSRVANSNFDVLRKLGAEIGICGPESFLPSSSEAPDVRIFTSLEEAIPWATVFMGLRIQLERHDSAQASHDATAEYHQHFGLSRERLNFLAKDAMIMHPGPINHGVEFSADVMKDPRCRVLDQVTNGVLIRAALLSRILEGHTSW